MFNRQSAKSRTSAYSDFRSRSPQGQDIQAGANANYGVAGMTQGLNQPNTSSTFGDASSWGSSDKVIEKTARATAPVEQAEFKEEKEEVLPEAPAQDAATFYEGGWRSGKDSGEIGWSDTWNEGGNFQQIKGDGKINAKYDERFKSLTNQDNTDVDNHGAGWKNLTDMGTMGSTEQMKSLAAEWEQAGYDVRIQDLEGHGGVKEANIAVRKGMEAPKEVKVDEEAPASQKLSKAQAYTQAYGDFRRSGGAVEQMAGNLDARDEFLQNYSLNLQRRMEPGTAYKVGNDDLPAIQAQGAQSKRSKIAADMVGKGAGFKQF